ncbi:hypothetical protein AAFN60_18590 [Roseibacillus persicicus]|uniref:methylation-associated defense system ATP-binding protein MAD8 n=1 Tax=Roseibacillus persicicus TaxID=454148 RepID=UPI00398BB5A7
MTSASTTTTQGISAPTEEEFNEELSTVLKSELSEIVRKRAYGHCMRVSDIDDELMRVVAVALREEFGDSAQIHLLCMENPARDPLLVTTTKLVELRNPLPNQQQRPPLLVFIPNNLKASAEDSFGEATFEKITLSQIYETLTERLLDLFPKNIRDSIDELRKIPPQRNWQWADPVMVARFLMSIRKNGYDPEVVGFCLYEIGLIPDKDLLKEASELGGRLSKNLDCVHRLTHSSRTERGKVIELELANREPEEKELIRDLGTFFEAHGTEDPRHWTRKIALDANNWPLSFDKWSFEDQTSYATQVKVEITEIGIEELQPNSDHDPVLTNLEGERVLIVGNNGKRQFKVKFNVSPHPETIPALDHFKLQIISRMTGAPVGVAKRKKTWKGGKTERSLSFTKLKGYDWEEGWHFVRILVYTDDNSPIPIVDDNQEIISNQPGDSEDYTKQLNDSDLFYVFTSDEVEDETSESKVPSKPSLAHAFIDQKFSAIREKRELESVECTSLKWTSDDNSTATTDYIEARFSQHGLLKIPVPRFLKELELRILNSPDGPLTWRVRIDGQTSTEAQNGILNWPESPELDAFLESRKNYFEKLRGKSGDLISSAINFPECEEEIISYAESYLQLLNAALLRAEKNPNSKDAIESIHKIVSLDRVDIDIYDHRNNKKCVSLIGPTHPLRAVWLLTWSQLSDSWASSAVETKEEFLTPTRDSLAERLKLINFPTSLLDEHGRILSCIDNVHSFWSLYASGEHTNPRGLIAELCTATGIPEPLGANLSLNPKYLAERIRRYLIQHPYVESISLNCFNPGRASLIANTLLELQNDKALGNLRYDIRLFVPDPEATTTGQELQQLLSPSSQLAENADSFSSPSGHHLSPKLAYSVRASREFSASPSSFPANLSLLFDVFPAHEVQASQPAAREDVSPIHGLLQDFKVNYIDEGDTVAWHRTPRHASAISIDDGDSSSHILTQLAEALSNAAVNVATNQSGLRLRPTSVLNLTNSDKALLHYVHEVSDWVFTVDRNLGIEFFDHGGQSDRPEYLIDHSPDFKTSFSPKLVITSRSLEVAETFFAQALEEKELNCAKSIAPQLLGALRALSGRLALKLISSATQRTEALGLALAKLYLDYQNAFEDQIVVPLDAHMDLYSDLRSGATGVEDVSLKRTDLALIDFNFSAKPMTITCRLVEVKCYQSVGGLAAYNDLKEKIANQINQSEHVLRLNFDPELDIEHDRPDRLIKNQELVSLLEFYVDRAYRLKHFSHAAWEEAKLVLRNIEKGYKLQFTRSSIIFDFEKDGTEAPTNESGIEYHRIGKNLIEELLIALQRQGEASTDLRTSTEVVTQSALKDTNLAIPHVETAAFKTEYRDRAISLKSDRTDDQSNNDEDEEPDQERPVLAPRSTDAPKEAAPSEIDKPTAAKPETTEPGKELNTTPEPEAHRSKEEESAPPEPETSDSKRLTYDYLLGETADSPQFGLLGKCNGRSLALDLNSTHTISLFGVQGGGKSYTLGSIIEMATMPISGINKLPKPLASVVFHYSQTQDYKPEFTSMINPNTDTASLASLIENYRAEGKALKDIVLLTPADKLSERRDEYPELEVLPLKFASSELQAPHWRFLMGAIGNQAAYIRQINQIMRGMRNNLTLGSLQEAVENSPLSDAQKSLAQMRLGFAAEYIDDSIDLGSIIKPGRLIIVDLRDEFIEKDEALGLFVVILQIFSEAKWNGELFNKLVVFDEAHKYIESPDLVAELISVVREMRHKGTSILVASQDPPSVPVALIELSSQIVLHKFNSPSWLKHIQKANAALSNLSPDNMARLKPGEAYLWSSKSTEPTFSHKAVKASLRPRITAHGGATKTAVQ